MMEAFQWGYLQSIAAAAGCILDSTSVDDGVDAMLRHKSEEHANAAKIARLELQLKATSRYVGSTADHISARVTKQRYDELIVPDPAVDLIVVILSMPAEQANWTISDHDHIRLHHCAYWVNLAGSPETTAAHPTISAPKTQPFNDVTLCHIMRTIGQGNRP